ncbi:hypothetical protein [uncultured Tenacibaculum sp.]|uniref:hypothetical protein n=1 Tax=uncultured Tenacibaculum sp. TaxID=174713 RepID=UPI0026062FD8|nr:hypothetical protein [uncultured Tenacibaculum sp.]
MNYGKEYIKLHNKELSAFKKEIIERIEKDYGSPEIANDLYTRYRSEIQQRINDIRENDNKGNKESSISGISQGYMSNKQYKFDRVENIINRDVYQYFLKHSQYSQYKDFGHFIKCFSKLSILLYYSSYLSDHRKLLCYLIDKEKAKDFFNIKYIKDDLNQLTLSKENIAIIEQNFSNKKVIEKTEIKNVAIKNQDNNNPFTEDEKFILIHYLFKHERSQNKKLSTYELTLILKISCGVFANRKLDKIKDTIYEKYHKGYDYYSIPKKEKKEKLNALIEKCEKFELKFFSQYLYNQLSKI